MHNPNSSKIITKRQIQGELGGGGSAYSLPNTNSTSIDGNNNSYYCMYVTLTNYDLSGAEIVDGGSPSNGDRILVANQTDASENGIYNYSSSGAWERVDGLSTGNQITILDGTKQGTIWVVETPTFEIGVDDISIIESAISRKDESFSLGFTPVTSLMTSDIALFQVSSNEIQSATVQDIMDTYGARGLWDSVTIKTADQDYENSNTLTDVSELTIDLEADELYDFLFEVLASKIGTGYGGLAFIQVHYTGTFEDGVYNKPDYSNEYQEREINPSSSTGADTLMNFFSKSRTPITGRIKTTTAGTLKLKMAYNDTPAVGLGWTVLNNSSLKVKKLDSFTNFQPTSGEANTGVNVGGEKEVYKSMSGTALQFRTLKEGTNVTLTQNTNDITIDVAGGGDWDETISKTTDKSVTSSTTLSDDSELQFSLDASSTYIGEIWIIWDRDTSGGDPYGKIDFAYTGTLTTGRGAVPSNITLSGTWSDVGSGNFTLFQPDSANQYVKIELVFETSTSGTLKVQWAQQVSQSGASILRAGTTMSIKKVK